MKNLFSLFILFLIAFNNFASAQVSNESLSSQTYTKIGNALSAKNKIFIRDVYSMGTLKSKAGGSLIINVIVAYEPGKEAERLRGLNIILTSGNNTNKSNSVYLDYEEVDNFVRSIVYFLQVSAIWKFSTKDSSEVSFTTKDNLRVGFLQRGVEQLCFVESGLTNKNLELFDIEDLNTIKLTLDKAKNVLAVK